MTSKTTHNSPLFVNAAELRVDLFENTPIPLMLVDKDGRIVRANLAEHRLLGYTNEEMQGKQVWEFVAEDEQDLSEGRFRAFLEGMELSTSLRRRFRTKLDNFLVCELSAQIIRFDAGDGPFVLLASVDVTRQVTEARIRGDFSRWMEASFRSLPEATMILDTLGQIRHLNRAAEKLLGWSEAEAAGEIPEVLIPWCEILSSEGTPAIYEFEDGISKGWSGSATVTIKGGIQKRLRIKTEPLIASNGIVLGISSCLSSID